MNRLSWYGGRAFHSSFSSIGIRTSLTRGLPSRETCCQGPVPTYLPCSAFHIRDFRRLAVAQTPITAPGDIGLVGTLPLRESSLIGTWSAIVCTLKD